MSESSNVPGEPLYPGAERVDVVDVLHGRSIADPYRWLEDATDERTQAWSAEQREVAERFLGRLAGREALSQRLADLSSMGEVGMPLWRGGRAFYGRRDAAANNAGLVMRDADGSESTVIDPDVIDPGGSTTLDDWQPSIEGDRVAYVLSGGDENGLLYVLDVETGATLEGPIDRCRAGDIAWLPGGEQYVYVRQGDPRLLPEDEADFHRRVFLHKVGADPDSDDVELLGEGLDITNYYWFGSSSDGRWLVVHAAPGTAPRTDVWISRITDGGLGEFCPVQSDVDAWTLGWVCRDRLCLVTDRDAPRGRMCTTDPADPSYDGWHDAIAEDPEATLVDAVLLDGDVALGVHGVGGASRVSWYSPTGEALGVVAGVGDGAVSALVCRAEGGREAWLNYADYTAPSTILGWRLDDPARVTTWHAAPGGAELPNVQVHRREFASKDGTTIRAYVIADADGGRVPRPTILTGYGGFGSTQAPEFSPSTLAWVEAGGVWVVPQLRGGSEHGEEWHRAGTRERKQNVFDDFTAVAEGLIAEGWTTSEQLGIMGGSNGGLLVGVALTQRPELYTAAVCSAPLLDMARYEQFGLGRTWTEEYGSAQVPEELDWLLAYSPYHHVHEGTAFPAVLFTVATADSRVDPMHARKMCAAMQYADAGGRPLILRSDDEAGHVAKSVSQSVALSADQLAFFSDQLGPFPER